MGTVLACACLGSEAQILQEYMYSLSNWVSNHNPEICMQQAPDATPCACDQQRCCSSFAIVVTCPSWPQLNQLDIKWFRMSFYMSLLLTLLLFVLISVSASVVVVVVFFCTKGDGPPRGEAFVLGLDRQQVHQRRVWITLQKWKAYWWVPLYYPFMCFHC